MTFSRRGFMGALAGSVPVVAGTVHGPALAAPSNQVTLSGPKPVNLADIFGQMLQARGVEILPKQPDYLDGWKIGALSESGRSFTQRHIDAEASAFNPNWLKKLADNLADTTKKIRFAQLSLPPNNKGAIAGVRHEHGHVTLRLLKAYVMDEFGERELLRLDALFAAEDHGRVAITPEMVDLFKDTDRKLRLLSA